MIGLERRQCSVNEAIVRVQPSRTGQRCMIATCATPWHCCQCWTPTCHPPAAALSARIRVLLRVLLRTLAALHCSMSDPVLGYQGFC